MEQVRCFAQANRLILRLVRVIYQRMPNKSTQTPVACILTRTLGLLAVATILNAPLLMSQNLPGTAPTEPRVKTSGFEEIGGKALVSMKARAEELKIKGVAVVAYIEGETVKSWSSKMVVVGSLKNDPSEKDPGSNLLAIAYSKASEMADTLKASGSKVRPPMKGEFGWEGGLVKKCRSGYVIAAFSGGPSEDDLKVSRVGLEILGGSL